MNTQSLYCNYSQKTGFKLEVEIYLFTQIFTYLLFPVLNILWWLDGQSSDQYTFHSGRAKQ